MLTVILAPNDPYWALSEARRRGLKSGDYIRASKPTDHYHLLSVDFMRATLVTKDGEQPKPKTRDEEFDLRHKIINELRSLNNG